MPGEDERGLLTDLLSLKWLRPMGGKWLWSGGGVLLFATSTRTPGLWEKPCLGGCEGSFLDDKGLGPGPRKSQVLAWADPARSACVWGVALGCLPLHPSPKAASLPASLQDWCRGGGGCGCLQDVWFGSRCVPSGACLGGPADWAASLGGRARSMPSLWGDLPSWAAASAAALTGALAGHGGLAGRVQVFAGGGRRGGATWKLGCL